MNKLQRFSQTLHDALDGAVNDEYADTHIDAARISFENGSLTFEAASGWTAASGDPEELAEAVAEHLQEEAPDLMRSREAATTKYDRIREKARERAEKKNAGTKTLSQRLGK